jgi:hypothetical protein
MLITMKEQKLHNEHIFRHPQLHSPQQPEISPLPEILVTVKEQKQDCGHIFHHIQLKLLCNSWKY